MSIDNGPNGAYLDTGPFFDNVGYMQAVRTDGKVFKTFTELGSKGSLPVNDQVLAAAKGENGRFFSDARAFGTDWRVYTIRAGNGYALPLARSLGEVNHTLSRVGILLIVIALGGIGVAAGLGLVVAQAALLPVRRLTEATEHVTETGDLSERIEPVGQDELG